MTNTPRTFKQWRADAVAILVLALALPLLWVLVQGQRISTSGHVTTGIVQNKEFSDGGSEGPDGYYLRYSFKDASRREYTGSGSVDQSLYDKTSLGDTIPIEYAAGDPRTNRIGGAFDPLVLYLVVFAAMGVSLFVYLGPRRWLRTWRGEPDPGPLE